MAILKCKMCGGDVELVGDKTFGTCEYCGCTMTFPKVEDDQRAAAFNRGNHFRRIGEFDKALAVYERIVQEDDTDAEAHWCCALCRFGIEYVEDPASMEWLPTCHRASFDSFLEDVDYLAAVKYSDGITRRQYQKDATKIAEVQRGILATSQNTEPYDVFICYKETDEQGNRTKDSLMAQDIYYQLTEQGRKVFFSRITLEDVAGTQYEPYIFAALNSARVMIVVGTSSDNLSAVWVKNEWSRFLSLMKKDHNKLLLPCYRDMDPYDLPEQLSVLQSYDMGKIGFIQDLIRGVAKVLDAEKKATPAVVKETIVTGGGGNVAPLLKRAFMFLEDGDWERANEFCEQVLNLDPECAEAYLGKLMAELRVKTREGLKDCAMPFEQYNNYQKALRFSDAKLQGELTGYINFIVNRNLTAAYEAAVKAMESAHGEQEYRAAMGKFAALKDFQDAEAKAQECREKAEDARQELIYQQGLQDMQKKTVEDHLKAAQAFQSIPGWKDAAQLAEICLEQAEAVHNNTLYHLSVSHMNIGTKQSLHKAIQGFESIPGWRDADEFIEICKAEIAKIEAQEEEIRRREREEAEKAAKRKKKIFAIIMMASVVIAAVAILVKTVIIPNKHYRDAVALMEKGEYVEAIVAFEELDGYRDSKEKIKECYDGIEEKDYNRAKTLAEKGKTAEAAIAFAKLGDFKDAREQSFALWDEIAVRETISAACYHTVGLKEDGTVTVVTAGHANLAYGLSDWKDVVAVSTGGYHTVGLEADGTVVTAGENGYGQRNVDGWTDIVAVSAGFYHTVGLKADGTVVAVGDNGYRECDVDGWTDIVAVSAGSWYTVGLKADGTVVAVGNNGNDQCNMFDWTDIVAVSAGSWHTVGLKEDGTVVAVGANRNGQCDVSEWTDIVAVSAGSDHTVGLKADGTVVAVGNNEFGKCDVSEWIDIVAISAGEWHTVGLKSDGTVVAVGSESNGRCDVDDWDLF